MRQECFYRVPDSLDEIRHPLFRLSLVEVSNSVMVVGLLGHSESVIL